MPVANNPYLEQFTSSLAEAGQVAQHLKQAAQQHSDMLEVQRRANAELAMRQQEHANQMGQQTLANQLAMNDRGATPISAQGTVPSMLPDANGGPAPMPTPDALSGIGGHPAFQNSMPAGQGHNIISMPDGSKYQIPTGAEQFATSLSHKLQESGAMQRQEQDIALPFKEQLNQMTSIPLPDALAQKLGIPAGTRVPKEKLPEFQNSVTNIGREGDLKNYRDAELGLSKQRNAMEGQRVGMEGKRLSLEQQKAAADKNPESLYTPAELQAYYEGRAKLPMRGEQRERIVRAITNTIDPQFDQSNADARFAMRKDMGSGKGGENVKGIQTAAGHLAQLEDQSDKLGGVNVGFGVNTGLNALKSGFDTQGAKTLGKYRLTQTALTSDLEKVLGGSKAMEGQRNLMDRLSPDMPPDVRKGALNEVRDLLTTRHGAIADQWSGTMGNTPPLTSLAAAKAALDRQKPGSVLSSGGKTSSAPQQGPAVGSVEGGYRFKGGDPSQANSWEKQ